MSKAGFEFELQRKKSFDHVVCEPVILLTVCNNAVLALFPDVDECATNNGGCHTNAICVNKIGSYNCYCKPGYQGDGTSRCDGTD